MERQVLRLLHRVRKPDALAATPLMASVCLQTGMANPVGALERIVKAALAGDDERTEKLRSAIFDADLGGPRATRSWRDSAASLGVIFSAGGPRPLLLSLSTQVDC